MRFRASLAALALSSVALAAAPAGTLAQDKPAAPAAPAAPAESWEKIDDDEGIAVFRREVPGSPVIAFKGVGVINAPIARVVAVVVDTPRTTEWMDSTAEARVVRHVGPLEKIVYTHITTPPIVMKDRDFVTRAKAEIDGAKKRFVVRVQSVSDPGAPPTSYVRGEIHHSSFILTSIDNGKKTQVVTEIHADPKGSVAKWVVNMFQKNWPHNTIKNLRKQVAKPDIKDAPELRAMLAEQGL
ncbi:MAG TPA: START domain-containing protein [Polyangiaceae bacterium]|nr:START domain-containing protein [Polyangiaceae bacterium]